MDNLEGEDETMLLRLLRDAMMQMLWQCLTGAVHWPAVRPRRRRRAGLHWSAARRRP
jgi:hypothetical protein